MKKLLRISILVIALLGFCLPVHALVKSYFATAASGGTTGAMDAINGNLLNDGDTCTVKTSSGVSFYYLNATSGATESIPNIIAPDSNPSTKRWLLSSSDNKYYVNAAAADQGANTDRSIKNLVDTIGGTKKATLVLTHNGVADETTYTLTTSETIPANITLEIENGAILDGAGTLTINGPFKSDLSQAFGSSITVVLNAVKDIYPQWFGAVGDGTTNDSAAVQRAVDATELVCGSLFFSTGTWAMHDILIDAPMELHGTGSGTTFRLNADSNSILEIYRIGSGALPTVNLHDFNLHGGWYESGVGIVFRGWYAGSLYNVLGNYFFGIMLDFDMTDSTATYPANANGDIHNVWCGWADTFIRFRGANDHFNTQLFFTKCGGWHSGEDSDFIDIVGNTDNVHFKDIFLSISGASRGITLNSGDAANLNNVYDNRFEGIIIVTADTAVPVVVNNTTTSGNTTPCIFSDCRFYGTVTEPTINAGANVEFHNVFTGGTLYIGGIPTLADDATPSVKNKNKFLTGGTTTITDFDDGYTGQEIKIISEHVITITDGTNIFLNGSTNFVMAATDTLTLICKADNKWYELARSDNT